MGKPEPIKVGDLVRFYEGSNSERVGLVTSVRPRYFDSKRRDAVVYSIGTLNVEPSGEVQVSQGRADQFCEAWEWTKVIGHSGLRLTNPPAETER